MSTARIVDVKHFAVHDGPGIRSTVFLKGCPLRCLWCHNPESQRPGPELAILAKCVKCGACAAVCPCHHVENGVHTLDRARCIACGKCVDACLYDALVLYGRTVSPEELMPELLADRVFYAQSGGGVTVSGGEPLLHKDLPSFLEKVRALGFMIKLDTNGTFPERHCRGIGMGVRKMKKDTSWRGVFFHRVMVGQAGLEPATKRL